MTPGCSLVGASPLGGTEVIAELDYASVITFAITESLALIKQIGERLCVKEITIKQGDSLAIKYGLGDVELYDWTCKIAVKADLSDAAALHEADLESISEDGKQFISLITRTVTKEWATGSYYVIADLYNETTGEAKEFQSVLVIEAQALTQE